MRKDTVGPFLRELAKVQHLFHWKLDKKSGRIFAVHNEYDRSFTAMEAVAWGETGLRYDDEFQAAQAIGMEAWTDAIKSACEYPSETELRRGILVAIGFYDK